MATYIVKPNQNLFDVALHIYGSIEGLFDILITNENLNMNSELTAGQEIEYHEGYQIQSSIVNEMKTQNLIPSNGERHVYFKETDKPLRFVVGVYPDLQTISFIAGGEGKLLIDWGDNTDFEEVELSHTAQKIEHYFDDIAEVRRVKVYGDFAFTEFDPSELGGNVLYLRPITVDEYVSRANGFSLVGLFLFEGTYKVDLRQCTVSDLTPLTHLYLQELDLRNVHFSDVSVLDDYLVDLNENYGTRGGCVVRLDTEPTQRGWGAINTILGDVERNTPTPWKFIINQETYTYNEQDAE